PVLHWLRQLALELGIRIKVRLVKGAYWDSEIKKAQQRGLGGYPVFTSKVATDISYLACARFLLNQPDALFPQFATHNALTVAAIVQMQPDLARCEFQRLHGMGETLYDTVKNDHPTLRLRIYAPVGEHRDLLPYLVRRLLENGANSSFMHQLHDPAISVSALAAHRLLLSSPPPSSQPRWFESSASEPFFSEPSPSAPLPMPLDIWQPQRLNSPGVDWYSTQARSEFLAAIARHATQEYKFGDSGTSGDAVEVINPATGQCIGSWQPATIAVIESRAREARDAQASWQQIGTSARAQIVERYAELLIEHRSELVALMARETGKTLENGVEEIREAVDFARYYTAQARLLLQPQTLPAVTGESNMLSLEPRGTVVCISPWNFPLAIFSGQIAAALLTGNAVLAKPAEQATLTALFATELLYRAGVPRPLLHLLPGSGETIGAALCAHAAIDGIVFTGGWETARAIQTQLAQRDGAMIPLIAETAGINALIADSTAQPQQLVQDVVRSAFDSAGQRCSA